MKIPHPKTAAYAVAKRLSTMDAVSLDELRSVIRGLCDRPWRIKQVIDRMERHEQLVIVGGMRKIAPLLRQQFAGSAPVDLVAPRTPSPFRALSAKHIPTATGMREGSNDARQWLSRHL